MLLAVQAKKSRIVVDAGHPEAAIASTHLFVFSLIETFDHRDVRFMSDLGFSEPGGGDRDGCGESLFEAVDGVGSEKKRQWRLRHKGILSLSDLDYLAGTQTFLLLSG